MGSANSKPALASASSASLPSDGTPVSAESADSGPGYGVPEDLGPYLSSLSLSGVRLHQVDARNYLGRLQDAEKFSQPSGPTQALRSVILRLLLWRREREHAASSWRQKLIEQQEQRVLVAAQAQKQQQHLQKSSSAGAPAFSTPNGLSASASGGFGGSAAKPPTAAASKASMSDEPAETEAGKDLTTLLRHGFDPEACKQGQQLARGFARSEKRSLNPREV